MPKDLTRAFTNLYPIDKPPKSLLSILPPTNSRWQ